MTRHNAEVGVLGRWAVIDFETATGSRDSACAIGLVLVDDGVVVARRRELIRPPGNEYEWFNCAVHGIAPEDTADAPDIADVWRDLKMLVEGRLLVAHNASFDTSVLRHSLHRAGLEPGRHRYACTLVLARRVWPDLYSWSLPIVAELVGLTFEHHDPLADAEAAAAIAIAGIEATGTGDLESALAVHHLQVGELLGLHWSPCGVPPGGGKSFAALRSEEDNCDETNPLFGKRVVFTGALGAMTRIEAAQFVVNAGGKPLGSVSTKTDYLVCGAQDIRRFAPGATESSKLRRFGELRADGVPIEAISEHDFLQMLGGREA